MGEPDPKYGYTFWATTHDSDFPIMFNYRNPVNDDQSIACEEYTSKTSAKGTEYLRLKGVKVLEDISAVSSADAHPPSAIKEEASPPAATNSGTTLIMSKLNDIHKDIKKLMGEDGWERVVDVEPAHPITKEDLDKVFPE